MIVKMKGYVLIVMAFPLGGNQFLLRQLPPRGRDRAHCDEPRVDAQFSSMPGSATEVLELAGSSAAGER